MRLSDRLNKGAVIGVGKSAICRQFTQARFKEEYDPSLEEVFKKQCNIDDQPASVHVFDTSGQHHSFLEETHLKKGDGFLIVFSLDILSSFNQVSRLHQRILSIVGDEDIPIFIIGNKSDVESGRQISASGKFFGRLDVTFPFEFVIWLSSHLLSLPCCLSRMGIL